MIYVVDDLSVFTQHDYNRCIPFLSEQRLKNMRQYRFERDRRLCMLSYMLLRFGLLREYGISEKPEFQLDATRKPQLAQWPKIHMNLSHCCEAVSCAIDIREVGIDVQNTEIYSDPMGRRTLTLIERMQIVHAIESDHRFTELWALKEAYGKYKGSGVLYELSNTDFSKIGVGWTRWNELDFFLDSSQRYSMAFCGERKLTVQRVYVQELIEQISSL